LIYAKKNPAFSLKKITVILPDLRGGGAERVAVNLANGFFQRGYAVEMVLMSATGEFLSDLLPEIRVVDLHVRKLRGVILPLARYLRQTRPDALLACMWPLTVIAPWARMLARVHTRVVVAEHTTWSRDEIASFFVARCRARVTMRFTFPQVDGVVAVSQGVADDLAHFGHIDRNSIRVIYNPVVSEVKPPKNEAPSLEPVGWWFGPHRRVLAVGTLKPIKDYRSLLSAFAKLCEQLDARLLILGEGECRPALEEQARQLGIQGRVFMPGFVKDLLPYYQRADLHVLSSTGEGLGMVIVEALAVGTPVVSTDCPSGPREILVDGKFGRLVPVGDPKALAEAMQDSLESEHDSGELIVRAQDFSIDRAVEQYLELLFPSVPQGINA
jgi:glycosyltransferase involved in cell wall biosynthesis